jgi:type I restriction enzyme S subunit
MKPGAYQKYQPSGLDWASSIPAGWSVSTLKRVAKFTTGWTPPSGDSDFYADDYFWANISDVGPRVLNTTSKGVSKLAIDTFNVESSKPGDLLFSFKLSIGQVSMVGQEMYTNEAIATFIKSEEYDIRWAFYAFPEFIPKNAEENIYGAPLLNQERIKNAKLFVPPLEEQRKIADFLDCETEKIDKLILKQEKLMEIYNERINNLVLDGLTNAQTKHMRLMHACDIISRPVSQSDDKSYRPLGLYNRGRGIFIKDERENDEMGDSDFFWIKEGDLIFSGQFAWEGAVALAHHEHEDCVVSHRYPVIRGKEGVALTEYLLALFLTSHGDFLLNENSRGAAGRNKPLNISLLLKEKIPILDMKSQLKIQFLIRSKEQFLKKSSEQIELLKERRVSLISAVVTGKIDVRKAA